MEAMVILKELDIDFRTQLGDEVYNDFKDYPLIQRVKMLKHLSKSLDKTQHTMKIAKNPSTPPPPASEHIPTLMERNRRDAFMEDLAKKTSFLNFREKLR